MAHDLHGAHIQLTTENPIDNGSIPFLYTLGFPRTQQYPHNISIQETQPYEPVSSLEQ